MIGEGFCVCDTIQHVIPVIASQNLADPEFSRSQGSRLVKYRIPDVREGFDQIRTLDQNAAFGKTADPGKERQRNRDHKRTGARDDQECTGPVQTGFRISGQKAYDNRHRNGKEHHRRGIDTRESRDEVFRFGLAAVLVFHKIENLRYRALAEFLRNPHFDESGFIDGAADDLIAFIHISEFGFAGKTCRIQRRRTADHNAVEGNLLARTDADGVAGAHFFRVYLHIVFPALHPGNIGTDIHQLADRLPAVFHRHILEEFTDLIEQHDAGRFPEITQIHRRQGGNAHQEILIEHLSSADAADRLENHVIAENHI